MGLDYLNKKVWHPGSMKNIQKVWEQEQIQKEINKKQRERNKKLQQQQHNEQLKRIQVEAGLIPRSHLDRMDWMYDWGNKIQQQKTNEEYLTGAKKAGDRRENKHVFQQEITNRKCQDFSLLHEDPLFEIQRQQKIRRDALMNNPLEMRNIIKEVEKQYLPDDIQERRKKHRTKHHRGQSSRSNESSRSRSRQKKGWEETTKSNKKSYRQSKVYQTYLKGQFGGILKEENGILKPDYSIHKHKYKTQFQIDEQERKRKIQQLRQNAQKLRQMRESQYNKEEDQKSQKQFQEGAALIRKQMMKGVRENRNKKKWKDSESE